MLPVLLLHGIGNGRRIKRIWQRLLEDEIEHLRIAGDLMQQYENRDPAEFLPKELPQLTIFQSNKDYVRDIIASQVDLTAKGPDYIGRKTCRRMTGISSTSGSWTAIRFPARM